MLSFGTIVAWLGLAFTVAVSLIAGARGMGSLRKQVDSNTERLSSAETAIRHTSEVLLPLAQKVSAHEDRVRELEMREHAQRAAVAETTKDVAVLVEQNNWIRASLERIEKRMDTLA